MSEKKIFGIDLGTTYSCISYVDEFGKATIVPNSIGELITPSVVFFEDDEVTVGTIAKELVKIHPQQVVTFIKRDMGKNYTKEIDGRTYRPEEISSYIIRKLVDDAKNLTGMEIKDVVITCPAYFGQNEKEATKQAGEIAGLNVVAVLQEPVAAAITYGLDRSRHKDLKNKVIMVYDLGGGTFDATLIELTKDKISVISTDGDHDLGGKDWDDILIEYCQAQYKEQTGKENDLMDDNETVQELYLSCENAKKFLTSRKTVKLFFTFEGDKISFDLSREKFDELTMDKLERTIQKTNEMLKNAKVKGYERIDEILLVGGSTRMPQVQKRLTKEYGIEPLMFDPDQAVAKGAALYGQKRLIEEMILEITKANDLKALTPGELSDAIEVIPYTLPPGSNSDGGIVPFVSTTITTVPSKSFGVIGLSKEGKKVIKNLIIKNDKKLPYEITERFGTDVANQEDIQVQVVENDSVKNTVEDLKMGNVLGELLIEGLPQGLPVNSPVDITFKMDVTGLLEITALEVTGNNLVKTTIQSDQVMNEMEFEEARRKSSGIRVM